MSFSTWIHHLFNPHCPECASLAEEQKICQSCETLKMQLSIANIEKRQMLDSILSQARAGDTEAEMKPVNYEELKPKIMTWNVRKNMLEAEDRKTAQILAERKKNESIDKLEKEVGLEGVASDA